ncbi:hypothetical protein [Synechococcus phage BUCT-ZZ01]|nr:hypothetical protein [Synechococcus phage BUCT-ZZ01]
MFSITPKELRDANEQRIKNIKDSQKKELTKKIEDEFYLFKNHKWKSYDSRRIEFDTKNYRIDVINDMVSELKSQGFKVALETIDYETHEKKLVIDLS